MKKSLIIVFLVFGSQLFASDNLLLIEQANKYYDESEYSLAVETYETIINNGFESDKLYYNLGNAYFKPNNLPMAIFYYEKAKKLNPYDADILFNLEIANGRIIDKIEPVPQFFLFKWWDLLVKSRTMEQWARVSIFSFIIFLVMALVFLLARLVWLRKTGFWVGVLSLALFILSFILANQQYNSFNHRSEAIIFTPTVTVKSSPRDNSTDIFVIHEGLKVQLTNQVGDWYEIKIADGSKGWIKENDVKLI
jgi:tetratricopeptide (TPR) repeat protein